MEGGGKGMRGDGASDCPNMSQVEVGKTRKISNKRHAPTFTSEKNSGSALSCYAKR